MRIPFFVVILLCLGVICGVGWHNIRKHDFLTPPPDSVLREIWEKAAPLPAQEERPTNLKEKEAPPEITQTVATIELGDFTQVPTLGDYRDQASKGTLALIDLAERLESAGQVPRALLAWERVLDSTTAEPQQVAAAIAAVQRIRSGTSDWKIQPDAPLPITFHAASGKTTALPLESVLVEIANELSASSGGILQVSAQVVTAKHTPPSLGSPPVALWFTGEKAGLSSTEIISFTVSDPEKLRAEVLNAVTKLLRGYLGKTAALTIPEFNEMERDQSQNSMPHITRLAWQELGSRLQMASE